MDPSLNTNKLGYETQKILLHHLPNELREDLRQVQGMKRMSDAVPLTFKKVHLKGNEREVVVKFHGRGTENVQMWKIIPGEMICSWMDGLETELSTKTTVFTNCSVFEKLNELLCHYLDREGTIVDLLVLNMLPRDIQFRHLILTFQIYLSSDGTDLSLLAAIQQPIEKIVIYLSMPERDTKCSLINNAKNIEIEAEHEFEKFYLYTPSTLLRIRACIVHPQAVVSLIKRCTRKSRPSGFQVIFEGGSKARPIVEAILADKSYDWKETQFENKNCHFIERNGQNIVLYYEFRDIHMHFISGTIRRDIPTWSKARDHIAWTLPFAQMDIPTLFGARNPIAWPQPTAETRNMPTSSGTRNQTAWTLPFAQTVIPTSAEARNHIPWTLPISQTTPIPTSSGAVNMFSPLIPGINTPAPEATIQAILALLPIPQLLKYDAASQPPVNPSNNVQELEIKCDNGKANRATVVGEEAVSKLLSGFGSRKVYEKLTIEGFCEEQLFDGQTVRVNNLTLLSEVPYPASFFEQFADEEFNSLTVYSERTLENDNRLRRNAKNVICLDTSPPNPATVVQDGARRNGTDGEPPHKKSKMFS